MNELILYVVGVFGLGVGGIVVGYALARLDGIYFLLRQWHSAGAPGGMTAVNTLIAEQTERPTSRVVKTDDRSDNTTKATFGKIDIDSRTVVTQINTAGLQRASSAEMGKTTQTTDEIDKSVSRLSQLKGK